MSCIVGIGILSCDGTVCDHLYASNRIVAIARFPYHEALGAIEQSTVPVDHRVVAVVE